jgi:hypothetical protein
MSSPEQGDGKSFRLSLVEVAQVSFATVSLLCIEEGNRFPFVFIYIFIDFRFSFPPSLDRLLGVANEFVEFPN